jgi:hypothetical protein
MTISAGHVYLPSKIEFADVQFTIGSDQHSEILVKRLGRSLRQYYLDACSVRRPPHFTGTWLHSSAPWRRVRGCLSELPSIAVCARTNVNDRRAAWLNQFR